MGAHNVPNLLNMPRMTFMYFSFFHTDNLRTDHHLYFCYCYYSCLLDNMYSAGSIKCHHKCMMLVGVV